MVNVITEEHLFTQQLHHETYGKSNVMVKAYDGFYCPTIGSITLPIEVGTKCLDVTFTIISTLDQFHMMWGHP